MRLGFTKVMVGIAIVAVPLAGCSDKQTGTATGPTTGDDTATTSQSTPTSTSSGSAPKVDNPLDASKYISQPCGVLSPATLQRLNISKPGKPETDSEIAKTAGPSCGWFSDDQPIPKAYDVGLLTGNKHGLSDTYRGGKKAFPGYFEPTEVNGYPAVFNDATDGRPTGRCNVTVGISDTLAFRVGTQFSSKDAATSCDAAKDVAAAVIQKLKEG